MTENLREKQYTVSYTDPERGIIIASAFIPNKELGVEQTAIQTLQSLLAFYGASGEINTAKMDITGNNKPVNER